MMQAPETVRQTCTPARDRGPAVVGRPAGGPAAESGGAAREAEP